MSTLNATLKRRNKKSDANHLVIIARAGTGKTTTLIEGLKLLKGQTPSITPSNQQQAIWDSLLESNRISYDERDGVKYPKQDNLSVCFVAFNKSIATELQNRVPSGCDAMTMHSMGLKAVTAAYGRQKVNGYTTQDLISEVTGRDIRELRKRKMEVLKATEKLASLVKMNLSETDPESLSRLAAHYDIDLNGSSAEVFTLTAQVIEKAKSPNGKINFDDMIWLPVINGLSVTKYDLLLVDEAQDLNKCQQELAIKASQRLIMCGDPAQAIYGFAGADSNSIPNIVERLSAETLPLTVTRRCCKAVVKEAQTYVQDFEAYEDNPEGTIKTLSLEQYRKEVQDGDMIVSRVNAPIVRQCFAFLREGRKAQIQGRDIGQGLISTIKKMKADNVSELLMNLSDWYHSESQKENAKKFPSETRLIMLSDRYECLQYFCEDQLEVADVISKIESVFSDDAQGIRLSSVHKAKGLESNRVFILRTKDAAIPHPMAKTSWQKEQEFNLLYVAITRAINELVYVTD